MLLMLLLAGCSQRQKQAKEPAVSEDFVEIDDAYHFYTIGDWGRNGHYRQKDLADMMNLAAMKVEPEFVISTGDNFYDNGIASVHDPYWKTSFEDVYDGAHMFCDWYVVLGNHDYRGNVQAQIDYTNVSRRWNMPGRYFLKDIETDDGTTARFVFIDTNPLNDAYYGESKYNNAVQGQDTTAQLHWMDSVLNTDVDWKMVIGHHPLYTGGKRANDEMWVKTHVEPLLEKHEVDVYFCGHEHDLQHIYAKDVDHIVSGAGSEVRPTGMLPESLFAQSIQGFVSTSITKDSLYHQFIDLNGEVIYSFSSK